MFSTFSIIAGIAAAFLYWVLVFLADFQGRQGNIVQPGLLFGFMFGTIAACPFLHSAKDIWHCMFSISNSVFLLIFVYDTLLLILLPALRKHFSSIFTYSLWFLPNILYIEFAVREGINLPKFVLFIPGDKIKLLLFIWGLGALGTFGWKVISHILFSHKLLRGANLVKDEKILICWNRCKKKFDRLPWNLSLYQSENTATPLTLGLFRKKVILPEKEYSNEELKWIFNHEMTHLVRNDIDLKFFIVFCTALFWPIPTMWFLLEKVAEDMELSCDETVLNGESEETRKLYSNLILQTGGSAVGFSTCLSATGTSVRYRLKQIIHPKKRNSLMETLICSLIVFLIVSTFGCVQISNEKGSAKDLCFDGEISKIEIEEDWTNAYTGSPKKLKNFLENETLYYIPAVNSPMHFDGKYSMDITVKGKEYFLDFQDQCMEVSYYDSSSVYKVYKVYYMPDKNWEKLF